MARNIGKGKNMSIAQAALVVYYEGLDTDDTGKELLHEVPRIKGALYSQIIKNDGYN